MNKIKTDYPLLQVQHYEELQRAAKVVQKSWIPAFAGMTDYLEPVQSTATRKLNESRH